MFKHNANKVIYNGSGEFLYMEGLGWFGIIIGFHVLLVSLNLAPPWNGLLSNRNDLATTLGENNIKLKCAAVFLTFAFSLGCLVIGRRCRFFVSDRGVYLRTVFRTNQFDWPEVKTIEPERRRVIVRLHDDRNIAIDYRFGEPAKLYDLLAGQFTLFRKEREGDSASP